MLYMKAASVAVLLFLALNGVQAVHGELSTPEQPTTEIVYVNSVATGEEEELQAELQRLKAMSNIREVLEANFRRTPLDEKRKLADAIYKASKLYDVDVELVLAVIQTESSYNPTAVSHVGAKGLMQLMPLTGKAMSQEIALVDYNTDHLFDASTNVMLGTYYLSKLMNRYGNLEYALTAYNAGPTMMDNVIREQRPIPTPYAAKVQGTMTDITEYYFE